jgi:pimeloyl-ACP methyl ester carboxylesterase
MNRIVYSNRHIKKNYLFIITIVLSTLIVSSSSISKYGYYNVANIVYGQANSGQANSTNTTALVDIQDIPLKKVHVGDIDIAYKMFGKGDPIILHSGGSDTMNGWDPALLSRLSSNHTVIVFDYRGIGNTTSGTEPYSVQVLANDTAGLMDALKIQKANVLGYSLGTFITQQFAIAHPDKVSRVIIIAGSCGGKDGIPKPVEFYKLQADIVNKTVNNIPTTADEMKQLVVASLGSGWIKLHPESLDIPANLTSLQQLKPGLPPEIANNQNIVGKHWEDNPTWAGACDELAKTPRPTLVITGTDDDKYQPHVNSLKIVEKIPGAWLVQIKDAGHAVMDQYPEEIGKIVNTFLSTISN